MMTFGRLQCTQSLLYKYIHQCNKREEPLSTLCCYIVAYFVPMLLEFYTWMDGIILKYLSHKGYFNLSWNCNELLRGCTLNSFLFNFFLCECSGTGVGRARHRKQRLCWHVPVPHQSWVGTAGTAAPRHLLMDSYQFNVQHLASWLNLHHRHPPLALKSARTHSPTAWLCPGAGGCSGRGKGLLLLSVKGAGKRSRSPEGWRGRGNNRAVKNSDWIKMGFGTSIHPAHRHIYSVPLTQALVPIGHSRGVGWSYLKCISGFIHSKKLCCSSRPLKPGQRVPHWDPQIQNL